METGLRIAEETSFDFDETSRLAVSAFGKDSHALSAERFRWTYETGYDDVLVLSAFMDGRKIGQFVAVLRDIHIGKERHKAAELIDLFVSPDHRKRSVIGGLYNGLKDRFDERGIRHIYAYPNEKAAPLNRLYFGLTTFSLLPMRIGVRLPFSRIGGKLQIYEDGGHFYKAYERAFADSLSCWDEDSFRRRLSSPIYDYICCGDGNVGFVCSPRDLKGVKILLVCSTYCNDPALFNSGWTMSRLLSQACKRANVRLFLYAGWNHPIDFSPGLAVPKRFMGDKFVVQSNFIGSGDGISKLELIDIDYA